MSMKICILDYGSGNVMYQQANLNIDIIERVTRTYASGVIVEYLSISANNLT